MQYTDQQLLERVKSLPTFTHWPEYGMLDIWVRSKTDKFNVFDDVVYTFNCEDTVIPNQWPVFVMKCSGTSNAGSYGLLNFRKINLSGCAVLCADTIVKYSHVYALHKGKPAYVQNIHAPFPYTRDNDLDQRAENYGTIYNDIIGANCHRAGMFSQFIVNWSVGCLVRNNLTEFLGWLRVMNKKPLTVAILNEF